MLTGTARVIAKEAAASIAAAARNAQMAMMNDPSRLILVDGTTYSPSWRALPGGEDVFQASYANPDVIEAFEEALDAEVERLTAELGVSVSWEDGCLYAEEVGA